MPLIMTMGEILVEFLAEKKNQSFTESGRLIGPYPSGAPAIFIDQVGKLGSSCGIMGCIGSDDFGRINLNRLKADGVTTDFIKILPDNTTGSAFVSYRDDGKRDFIYYITHAACGQFNDSMVTEEALLDCRIFHIMGTSLFSSNAMKAARRAVRIVRANGGKISFDPNLRKEMLEIPGILGAMSEIMQQADILLPSEGELNLLLQCDDEREATEKAFTVARNLQEIIIKQGAKGCQYYSAKGNSFHVPGYDVEEIDPTGAGDCFGATYIHFYQEHMETQQALKYANAAGACAVRKRGPMEGNSTLKSLDEFIASQG